MEITKELIASKKVENPGCKIAKVVLKADDEKSVALEILVRSEAEKWEATNPGKAKEIYVKSCVLTDVEKVVADDNLFYQAYFAITDLLPFQKPETEIL